MEKSSSTAERLKQAMALRGMKQSDVASKTGIVKSAISQYLSNKVTPKQDKIYLLASALQVNEAWLMGLDVPMEQTEPIPELYDVALEAMRNGQLMRPYQTLSDEKKRQVLAYVEALAKEMPTPVCESGLDAGDFKVAHAYHHADDGIRSSVRKLLDVETEAVGVSLVARGGKLAAQEPMASPTELDAALDALLADATVAEENRKLGL